MSVSRLPAQAATAHGETVTRRHYVLRDPQPKPCKCGEPWTGGDFGWFTVEENGKFRTYCNRCGSELTRRRVL